MKLTRLINFERCAQVLIDKWKHGSKKQFAFVEYFETYKKEQFKYHVSKNAVSSAWIIDAPNGNFFNDTSESMNKLIKDWHERKKLYCVRFAEEFEDLISQQESDILWTFLGVSSPYIIRKEYLHLAMKFNTDFSNKTVQEKAEIKKIL